MLYNNYLLERKRALILAAVNDYNEALLNSSRPKNDLNQMKALIKQFNNKQAFDRSLGFYSLSKLLGLNHNPNFFEALNPSPIRLLKANFLKAVDNNFKLKGIVAGLAAAVVAIISAASIVVLINLIALLNPLFLQSFLGIIMPCLFTLFSIGFSLFFSFVLIDFVSSVHLHQAFDPDVLESYFQGSELDKLMAELSVFSPAFLEHYPVSTFKKILAGIPTSIKLLDLSLAELDKLPLDYLNQLANAAPRIESIKLSKDIIEKMSFEQLDALAKITPNAKIMFKPNTIPSEKMDYLISSSDRAASHIAEVLSQWEAHPGRLQYPRDIINYTSGFFPNSSLIIEKLKNKRSDPVAQAGII